MFNLTTDRGPFCQSCGMPLVSRADFGTDADGIRINDYCHFCFDRGRFTQPDVTASQMIDRSASFLCQQTWMTAEAAHTHAAETIPKLKRWHSAQAGTIRADC